MAVEGPFLFPAAVAARGGLTVMAAVSASPEDTAAVDDQEPQREAVPDLESQRHQIENGRGRPLQVGESW